MFSGQPAGVERVSRVLQLMLNRFCERMRATKYASYGLRRLLECINGLAEIVVCGGGVDVERLRVSRPYLERELITLAEDAPRHRQCFTHQCLHFFEAP